MAKKVPDVENERPPRDYPKLPADPRPAPEETIFTKIYFRLFGIPVNGFALAGALGMVVFVVAVG